MALPQITSAELAEAIGTVQSSPVGHSVAVAVAFDALAGKIVSSLTPDQVSDDLAEFLTQVSGIAMGLIQAAEEAAHARGGAPAQFGF